MILVHDLDRNKLADLKNKLESAINPSPIKKYLICIPIEEFEAWLLSDSNAIKESLYLYNTPQAFHHPEKIVSPKEKLSEIIHRCSKKEKQYINTKHNQIISEKTQIDSIISKCPSFMPFYNFVKEKIC